MSDPQRLQKLTEEGDLDAARAWLQAAQRRNDTEALYLACAHFLQDEEWTDVMLCYQRMFEGIEQEAKCKVGEWHEEGQPEGCYIEVNVPPVGASYTLCKTCDESTGLHLQPAHRLCNAIALLAPLTRRTRKEWDRGGSGYGGYQSREVPRSDNPSAQTVLYLWLRALQLWWPVGWREWLIGHMEGLESIATDATPLKLSTSSPEKIKHMLKHLPEVPECICYDAGVERGRCPEWLVDDGGDHRRAGVCSTCDGSGECPRCGGDE